jgi:hypothetical protein
MVKGEHGARTAKYPQRSVTSHLSKRVFLVAQLQQRRTGLWTAETIAGSVSTRPQHFVSFRPCPRIQRSPSRTVLHVKNRSLDFGLFPLSLVTANISNLTIAKIIDKRPSPSGFEYRLLRIGRISVAWSRLTAPRGAYVCLIRQSCIVISSFPRLVATIFLFCQF